MEADLARQVEYDMDEQGEPVCTALSMGSRSLSAPSHASPSPRADQIWLDAVNRERTGQGIAPVPYETFEIIFDKLEKEWFDLVSSPLRYRRDSALRGMWHGLTLTSRITCHTFSSPALLDLSVQGDTQEAVAGDGGVGLRHLR